MVEAGTKTISSQVGPMSNAMPLVVPMVELISHALHYHKLHMYEKHSADISVVIGSLGKQGMADYLVQTCGMKRGHIAYFISHIWCGPGAPTSRAQLERQYMQTPLKSRNVLDTYQASECMVTSVVGAFPGSDDVMSSTPLRLQRAGGDAVGSVPVMRWTNENIPAGHTFSHAQQLCAQHGGFIDKAYQFDWEAFSISPGEAKLMDPQQRLVLEHGYTALHDAMFRRNSLLAADVGVFLGIERPDWIIAQPPAARASLYAVTCDNVSVASGRISFILALQGTCCSVDTACSSSLVAMHSARLGLHESYPPCGTLTLAVSLKLVPHVTLGVASAGMLSIDGRCKTLDRRANGYTRAEGIGASCFVLADAEAASFSIRSSAVQQDGRSASLTAPNGAAQVRLLNTAMKRCAQVRDSAVIEIHGTGTALGDPTEMGTVKRVHSAHVRAQPLTSCAAKANFGHAESASGFVGILRMQNSFKFAECAANAHLRAINKLIRDQLDTSTTRILLPIQSSSERKQAGSINSFGFSGTIAHCIMRKAHNSQPIKRAVSTLRFTRKCVSWTNTERSKPRMFIACWASMQISADKQRNPIVMLTQESPPKSISRHSHNAIAYMLLISPGSSSVTASAHSASCVLHALLTAQHARIPLALLSTCGSLNDETSQGFIWGFTRAARVEHPSACVICSDVHVGSATPTVLCAVLDVCRCEPELQWKVCSTVSRLRALSEQSRSHSPFGGTCLITGGTGALGLQAATYLSRQETMVPILCSRSNRFVASKLQPTSAHLMKALACDMGDLMEARQCILASQHLSMVLHAAGELHDRLLRFTTARDLIMSFTPKAFSASHLHQAIPCSPIAGLVFFSSAVSLFGNVGQANYAAANTQLDVLARARRDNGTCGSSLQIPPVKVEGMGASTFSLTQLEDLGALAPDQFVIGLFALMTPGRASAEQCQAPLLHSAIAQVSTLCIGREISVAAECSANQEIHTEVVPVQACVLRIINDLANAPSGISEDSPLMDAGIDSLAATELASKLQAATGAELLPTLVFEYPTTRLIIQHVQDEVHGHIRTPDVARVQTTHSRCAVADTCLAGSSLLLPKRIADTRTVTIASSCSSDAISQVPVSRWLTSSPQSQSLSARMRHGGFISTLEYFDSKCFGIVPAEAKVMDPQQRVVLEQSQSALNIAQVKSMIDSVGVYLGAQRSDFLSLLQLHTDKHTNVHAGTGSMPAMAAGRISYIFGYNGPCMTLDTACSSALVAVHVALQSLRTDPVEMALAGGVNVMLAPISSLALATLGISSSLGQCSVFDARADGYVRSEACAMHVLRSAGAFESAIATGSAVCQNGKGASLTAPSGSAQQLLLATVMASGSSREGTCRCVEAAANGSPLGDPLEVRAVQSIVEQNVSEILHNVKSSCGHSEPASGGIGLCKLATTLRGTVVTPNAQLRCVGGTIRTMTRKILLTLPAQLCFTSTINSGGVSSFGLSGTLAHARFISSSQHSSQAREPLSQSLWFRRRRWPWTVAPVPPCVTLPEETSVVAMSCEQYQAHAIRLYQSLISDEVDGVDKVMDGAMDSVTLIAFRQELVNAFRIEPQTIEEIVLENPTFAELGNRLSQAHAHAHVAGNAPPCPSHSEPESVQVTASESGQISTDALSGLRVYAMIYVVVAHLDLMCADGYKFLGQFPVGPDPIPLITLATGLSAMHMYGSSTISCSGLAAKQALNVMPLYILGGVLCIVLTYPTECAFDISSLPQPAAWVGSRSLIILRVSDLLGITFLLPPTMYPFTEMYFRFSVEPHGWYVTGHVLFFVFFPILKRHVPSSWASIFTQMLACSIINRVLWSAPWFVAKWALLMPLRMYVGMLLFPALRKINALAPRYRKVVDCFLGSLADLSFALSIAGTISGSNSIRIWLGLFWNSYQEFLSPLICAGLCSAQPLTRRLMSSSSCVVMDRYLLAAYCLHLPIFKLFLLMKRGDLYDTLRSRWREGPKGCTNNFWGRPAFTWGGLCYFNCGLDHVLDIPSMLCLVAIASVLAVHYFQQPLMTRLSKKSNQRLEIV